MAEDAMVHTLKRYCKLCSSSENRADIVKDAQLMAMLVQLLASENNTCLVYTIRILLLLTETTELAAAVGRTDGLESAVAALSDKSSISPSVAHNSLLLLSRLRSAKTQMSQVAAPAAANCRKFVTRKSKEVAFEFEALSDDEVHSLESAWLACRGVISISFSESSTRAVLRVLYAIDANSLRPLFFKLTDKEELRQRMRHPDGQEEWFAYYAENELNTGDDQNAGDKMPDYLDDVEISDPTSCVLTKEAAEHAQSAAGGWLSGISQIIRGALW